MNFSSLVKAKLNQIISQISSDPSPFVLNPNKDFTRVRSLPFSKVLKLILNMQSLSLNKEILHFFRFQLHAPSTSAFVQQRAKIKPLVFLSILRQLNNSFPPLKQGRFSFVACDGSDVSLSLFRNPDPRFCVPRKRQDSRDCFQFHIHALFDPVSERYLDLLTEPHNDADERQAFKTMLTRNHFSPDTIILTDRGYEGYDSFALIDSLGLKFVCRVKDGNTGGVVKSFHLPKDGEYDYTFDRIYTMKNSKLVKTHPEIYHPVRYNRNSVFLNPDHPEYRMKLRIVRLQLDDDYECLITNLPDEEVSPAQLKKIYWLRWGIETSFRELKYTIGLVDFHSGKVESIEQEILARAILYNFCQIIVKHTESIEKHGRYLHKTNLSTAVYICRNYLFEANSQYNVEALIRKYTVPIRPGRKYPRKLRSHAAVGFTYRR